MTSIVIVVAVVVITAAAVNVVSQAAGWNRPVPIVMLQALTRPLLIAVAVVAVAAVLIEAWPLAAVVAAVGISTTLYVSTITRPAGPTVRAVPERGGSVGRSHPTITIAHGNVWYENEVALRDPQRVVDALRRDDPDVIAVSEYSHEIAAAFESTDLRAGYPYGVSDPGDRAEGCALFAKRPVVVLESPVTEPRTATVELDGLTICAVHTPSPLVNLPEWTAAIEGWARRVPQPGRPTVAIGDYNADLVHPVLRATLAAGWRDAHRELGATASTSWPTHLRGVPPFVRLDRALVSADVELIAVTGGALPGSDHRVVTVTVALPTLGATAR